MNVNERKVERGEHENREIVLKTIDCINKIKTHGKEMNETLSLYMHNECIYLFHQKKVDQRGAERVIN